MRDGIAARALVPCIALAWMALACATLGGCLTPGAVPCIPTVAPSPTVATGLRPRGIAIDSSGKHAYVADFDGNQLSQFTIDVCGGLIPMNSPTILAGWHPQALAAAGGATPAVYVANFSSNNVSQYSIGAGGELTPLGSAVASGAGPSAVAVLGKHVYVTNSGSNTVSQYSIGARGELTPLDPPTAPAGLAPNAIAASGAYVYVANTDSNTVSQYAVTPAGTLNPLVPSALSIRVHHPLGLAVDPAGTHLYVTNGTFNEVTQYVIGPGGRLAPDAPIAVASGLHPQAIAIDPTGSFVYVTNQSAPNTRVSQYAVGTAGRLAPLSPAQVTTGTGFNDWSAIAVDPSGQFVYVTHSDEDTVSQYTIDADGRLRPQ